VSGIEKDKQTRERREREREIKEQREKKHSWLAGWLLPVVGASHLSIWCVHAHTIRKIGCTLAAVGTARLSSSDLPLVKSAPPLIKTAIGQKSSFPQK